jgi:NADPH:quinone reductase-like Zn-dependent oxidoreductase
LKAIAYTKYGSPDVLRLTDAQRPAPADDEILVRVRSVSVNRSDWEALTGKPFYARLGGLLKPRNPILGSDVAGQVEATGRNHSQFKPGDEVFGEMAGYRGGFAEYVCTRGSYWAIKPPGLSFEQAAAIPQAGVIALQGLRNRIQPGQSVLINGAGGGAGSFAIQLAKIYGAEVSGVDNAAKLGFMRSLGADHVIDYTREDFTRNARRYDLIVDLMAYRSAFACARALKPNGRYCAVGGSLAAILHLLFFGPLIRTSGRRMGVLMVRRNRADLELIAELCASGKIVAPIDRRYPLSEAPDALRYLGEGHAKGKLVILV